MALVLKDRVRETSTTTGTGTLTLAGAVAGFQSFSAIGTGNTTYYTIATSSDWEVGIGTWTSPNQLSRNTILASTNGGAAVNFGAGTKDVFVTLPSERAVYTDAAGNLSAPPPIGGTTPNTITGTTITATASLNLDYLNGTETATIYIDSVSGSVICAAYDIYSSAYPFQFNTGITSANIGLGDFVTTGITIFPYVGATYNLTLPSSAGSANQVLTTSGSAGVLSWTSVQKTITSGTAAPSGGSDGDIYLQYV